jgi:hypothetical protein
MSFFFLFTKSENRRAKQVLLGVKGVVSVLGERSWEKGVGE